MATLISKVDNAELTRLLANPNAAMKKGGMPPIQGKPEQIGSLIAYLRTLRAPQQSGPQITETMARADSQSHKTPAAPAASVATSAQSNNVVAPGVATAASGTVPGRALFRSNGCVACHGINAQGTPLAPSLVGVADKYPGDKLPALLHNPTKKMQEGGMPPITLDDKQIEDLIAYLSSLNADSNNPAKTEKATETAKENEGLSQLNAASPEGSGSPQNPH
jgi:mono/diheme cytochrome c family protein